LKLTASTAKPNMTEWTYQCNLPLLQGQQHLMAIRCKACFGSCQHDIDILQTSCFRTYASRSV